MVRRRGGSQRVGSASVQESGPGREQGTGAATPTSATHSRPSVLVTVNRSWSSPVSRGDLVVAGTGRWSLSVVADRIEHMIETLAGPGAGEVDDLTARDLLALARDRKAAEDRAAADLLVVAARWADLHPPESIHVAAAFTVPGCEHEEPIAGRGCAAGRGVLPRRARHRPRGLDDRGEEAGRPRPRAPPPPPAPVGAGPRRTGAGVARPRGRRDHHPLTPALTRRGCRVRRRPGRRRRRSRRCGAAGPARRRDDQALRPRRRRPDRRIRRTATSTSTRATPRSTTTTCTTPARCASRPSSTSPTPSTSTAALAHGAATLKALGSDGAARRTPFRCPRRPGAHPDRPRPVRPGATGARDVERSARRPRSRAARPLRRVPRRAGHRVRAHRADGGRSAPRPPRPGPRLVLATPARRSP